MQPSRMVRLVVTLLVAASMAVGGIALASDHGGGGPGNSSLFKPGKGCGDKNHIHYRENECDDQDGNDQGNDEGEGHGHGHGNDQGSDEGGNDQGNDEGEGHGNGNGGGEGHGHGDNGGHGQGDD